MAARHDLQAWTRTTFERRFVWLDENENPVDLTGYEAHLHMRRSGVKEPAVEASTENEKISITPEEGKIELHLTAEDLNISSGTYSYDLLLIQGEYKKLLLYGTFSVSPVVTKP